MNAIVGAFVVFVLFVFQPFGIADLESNTFLICLGFGIAGLASSLIYEFILTPLVGFKFSNNQMNFGKWMIYMFGILLIVSLGNFLYARMIIFGYIAWQFYPAMMYGTLMIGFFPIVLIGWFLLLTQEKKYQDIANELNSGKSIFRDVQSSPNRIFDIAVSQVRYIQAFQNYVRVGYIDEQGSSTELMERATIKSIMSDIQDNTLVRCHRSYIVNQNAITSTSGNAQGLLLQLSDCEKKIPVSRTYVPVFRSPQA